VLATPLMNYFEQKYSDKRFVRVDADVVEKLIPKDDAGKVDLSLEQKNEYSPIFQAVTPKGKGNYIIDFVDLGESELPMVITQNEFMRRMKDMSSIQPGMSFYGDMPDSYNLVVNVSHPLVKRILDDKEEKLSGDLEEIKEKISQQEKEKEALNKLKEGKKEEEVPQEEKDKLAEVEKEISAVEESKRKKLEEFGKKNDLAKELVDLALLANNMLRGEDLNRFVKRSVKLLEQ